MLAEGRSRDEIVEALSAGGLSKATAERFVDREMSAAPAAASAAPPLEAPRGGTMYSGPTAPPPPAVGMAERGIKLSTRIVFAVIALAAIVSAAIFAQRVFDADRMVNERVDGAGANAVRRKAGDAFTRRQNRNRENVDALIAELDGPKANWSCEPVMELGRTGSEFAVQPVVDFLRRKGVSQSVLICGAGALVELGEIEHAMGYYRMWVQGDNYDLWRSALIGMGDIGPDAAREAIPLLAYEVDAERWDRRWLAATILGKLGPDAEELLTTLAEDEDERVAGAAALALKQLQ
jgi:hypothetical protein